MRVRDEADTRFPFEFPGSIDCLDGPFFDALIGQESPSW